jgi:chorismate dehydratase
MSIVRLGAVSYLNTKPLVYGLEQRSDLFTVRFDVPAQCAALLHEGRVDLGLIPAIEYLRGDYRIVPGIAIGSDGEIASVAVFSKVPIERIATLALDVSSRTSVALTRVLCARKWRIAPKLVPADPDLRTMLSRADAGLVIGDPALSIDPAAQGLIKVDLGSEWRALTGLPFVYAMWCGREGVVSPQHVEALNETREKGEAAIAQIARVEGRGVPAHEERALRYLRDNLKYGLGEAELAGLQHFHELAADCDLVPGLRPLRFYAGKGVGSI